MCYNITIIGTGYLDKEAVRRILGADASDVDVRIVMKDIDLDNDGKIDYREFAKFWKQLQLTLTPKKRVINAANNVNRSLKVIGMMKAPSMKAPAMDENAKSTSLLPAIAGAQPAQSSVAKKLLSAVGMGIHTSSSSNTLVEIKTSPRAQLSPDLVKLTPRSAAAASAQAAAIQASIDAQTPAASTGILGGIYNMFSGNNNNTVNVDDPQSMGRKQWTQLRQQKVCSIDVIVM